MKGTRPLSRFFFFFFFLAYGQIVVPVSFIEKTILSQVICLCTCVKNQLTVLYVYSLISRLCCTPLMWPLFSVPLYVTVAFTVNLLCDSSNLVIMF